MIPVPFLKGKRVLVMGLGKSGTATARALLAAGAGVMAWDDGEAGRKAAAEAGIPIRDPAQIPLEKADLVVWSPGIPHTHPQPHPVAERVRAAGVPLVCDVELLALAKAGSRMLAVTGTNGKSTTTALIHHILETAGIPARLGGNIGLPILGQDPLPEGGVYVLELSSYQIDLTHSLDCDVAVLLNITPDHLDRYDGFEAYAASKARLFAMQSRRHAAIIGIGDEPSAAIAREVAASGRGEDLTRIAPGACLDQSRWPALQGPHNAQNALAAIAACRALGIDREAIDRGLESFPGLPHRMERVKTRNGVLFVNDSKATNADSTAPALSAYPRIHWILGGKAKTDDLDACRPGFPHVVKAYTIGDAGEMFARLLEGEMPVERSGTLDVAVKSAAAHAQPGDVVLLSPACASFDQFRDYEARGQAFRDAVEALG